MLRDGVLQHIDQQELYDAPFQRSLLEVNHLKADWITTSSLLKGNCEASRGVHVCFLLPGLGIHLQELRWHTLPEEIQDTRRHLRSLKLTIIDYNDSK